MNASWTGQRINITDLIRKMEADQDFPAFAVAIAKRMTAFQEAQPTTASDERLDEIIGDFECAAEDASLTGEDLDNSQMFDLYNWADDMGVWIETVADA